MHEKVTLVERKHHEHEERAGAVSAAQMTCNSLSGIPSCLQEAAAAAAAAAPAAPAWLSSSESHCVA